MLLLLLQCSCNLSTGNVLTWISVSVEEVFRLIQHLKWDIVTSLTKCILQSAGCFDWILGVLDITTACLPYEALSYPWWFSLRRAACMTRIFHAQNHWCIFPFSLINGGWLILHLFRKCVMHEWLCVCKSVVECFSVWICIFVIYTIWEIHMLLCFMKCMQLLTQLIVWRHSHVSVH